MPRQLKILKGIIEEEPTIIRDKINVPLGDTIKIAEEISKQLSKCLKLLLDKDQISEADQAIIDLGVRFWNDIGAANILVYDGLILNAMMMERDAVETRVIAEYLHKNPQKADAWQKATTLQERRQFELSKLKNNVDDGSGWKEIYDDLSSYIHANRISTPAYSRNRPYFGHNLYLGGFYDPAPIAGIFLMQTAICKNFVDSFVIWYKDELTFPIELTQDLEVMGKTFHAQAVILKQRADAEQNKIESEINTTRLSNEEIIKMFKFLDTLP